VAVPQCVEGRDLAVKVAIDKLRSTQFMNFSGGSLENIITIGKDEFKVGCEADITLIPPPPNQKPDPQYSYLGENPFHGHIQYILTRTDEGKLYIKSSIPTNLTPEPLTPEQEDKIKQEGIKREEAAKEQRKVEDAQEAARVEAYTKQKAEEQRKADEIKAEKHRQYEREQQIQEQVRQGQINRAQQGNAEMLRKREMYRNKPPKSPETPKDPSTLSSTPGYVLTPPK
jgi:hypothetical protein